MIWEIRAKARPIRRIDLDLPKFRGVKTSWTACWQAESVLSRLLSFFQVSKAETEAAVQSLLDHQEVSEELESFQVLGGASDRFFLFSLFRHKSNGQK